MNQNIPKLSVYYIDFSHSESNQPSKNMEVVSSTAIEKFQKPSAAKKVASTAFTILNPGVALGCRAARSITKKVLDGTNSSESASILDLTAIKALKNMIDEKHFHIITSEQELAQFENANGNAWVYNDKSFRQRQYYVRHPKLANRNLLIEVKAFHRYIEDEQKEELIAFVCAKCPAKTIKIDKTEISGADGCVQASVEGADIYGGGNYGKVRGDHCNLSNPNGLSSGYEPREYLWIDRSLMRSISSLKEGGTLSQSYENDFTFGLSLGEAKTIGLDTNMHKKYRYSIYIEC